MALVVAVAALAVIGTMTVTLLSYTSASARDASLKQSGQSAYALAEAGVHQALAQLSSHYYDANGKAFNASTPFATGWFTGVPASQQSPTSAAACTTGSTCMSWSVRSCAFVVAVTGCGPLTPAGIRKGTVVLSGSGSVPNPTGGAPQTRTVTVNVDVQQPTQLVPTPSYWKEIYTGAPTSSTCDLSLGQGVSITAPISSAATSASPRRPRSPGRASTCACSAGRGRRSSRGSARRHPSTRRRSPAAARARTTRSRR
jgi:hypothetical protein